MEGLAWHPNNNDPFNTKGIGKMISKPTTLAIAVSVYYGADFHFDLLYGGQKAILMSFNSNNL
jgi:hypothetical protein